MPEPLAAELPAAMAPGDLDVAARVSFQGWSHSPLSAAFAFVGWNEIGGTVELGAVALPDTTLAFGVDGWYARPALDGFGRMADVRVGGDDLDWRVWSAGVSLRTALHLTSSGIDWPAPVDPYAIASIGPALSSYAIGYRDRPATFAATGETSVRTALGAGARWHGDGWFGAVELTYAIVVPLDPAASLLVAGDGTQAALWVRQGPAQRPRGFGWTFALGRRL